MTDILWDERGEVALPDGWEETLSNLLKLAIAATNAPEDCEISLSFVTKEEIKAINALWRRINFETDVLSFPFFDGPPQKSANGTAPAAFGEIVICTDVALLQAEAYGHSFIRELSFLTVHGFLHLIGFDHDTEKNEKTMFALQDEILSKAGIGR